MPIKTQKRRRWSGILFQKRLQSIVIQKAAEHF